MVCPVLVVAFLSYLDFPGTSTVMTTFMRSQRCLRAPESVFLSLYVLFLLASIIYVTPNEGLVVEP